MRTVLLIEDEALYAGFLGALIGHECALLIASNLHDGVALLQHRKADVVLLDLSLPDSAKEQTLAAFKQSHPTIPIIIVSGTSDPRFIEQCILDNCYGYIVKGKTDTRQQIMHEIEEAIKYAGWNQVIFRAKEKIKTPTTP